MYSMRLFCQTITKSVTRYATGLLIKFRSNGMPLRRVGPAYQLDANRINARQKDSFVNQLEKWHNEGVIFLEMPHDAYIEARHGSKERAEKADNYTWISTNDSIGGETEIRRKIEAILFPSGTINKNQQKDVMILFTARQASATLITADGDSKTQPGGILGNACALAKLGIRVLSAQEAVNEVTQFIYARDQMARQISNSTGAWPPHWVRQDDPF